MKHEIVNKDLSRADANKIYDLYENHVNALSEYVSKLLWWNKKMNLVSRDVSRETVELHVLHSLVISLSSYFEESTSVVDAGTGGGLPGIPLAITSPDREFILNDVVKKKLLACKSMCMDLGLNNIQVEARSIEYLGVNNLLISKHAFKLNDLYKLIENESWKSIILLKGREEVELELDGISDPLLIEITDLYSGFESEFFEGKALVEIKRKGES